jgi:hypothetical protein
VFGPVHSETLTNLRPPVGWADVATKHDLEQLEQRLDMRSAMRFDLVDDRFERARAEWKADLEHGLRQQLITFLSANAVLLGIVVTIIQLTR